MGRVVEDEKCLIARYAHSSFYFLKRKSIIHYTKREGETNMSMLAFFPWLRTKTTIEFDRINLVPFQRGQLPGPSDSKLQTFCDRILESYVTHNNKSIRDATLIFWKDKDIFCDLRDEETNWLFLATEIIAFSGIARRRFFWIDGYCNRDDFNFFIQSFKEDAQGGSTIITRRRDGEHTTYCSKKAYKVLISEHVNYSNYIGIDISLANALFKAWKELHGECWLLYSEALFDFNRANTDDYHVSPHHELVMSVGAFQRTLNSGQSKEKLIKNFMKLFKPTENLELLKSVRITKCTYTTIREIWLDDFCKLRNDYAHGKRTSRKPCIWKLHEHLLLASYVFPLLVKCKLQRDGFYTLTDDDKFDINVFEKLSDADLFKTPIDQKGSMDWEWNRIRSKEKLKEISAKICLDLLNRKLKKKNLIDS